MRGALDEEKGKFCCGFQGSKLGRRGISRNSSEFLLGLWFVARGLFCLLTYGFVLSFDLQVGTIMPSDKDLRQSLVQSPPFSVRSYVRSGLSILL